MFTAFQQYIQQKDLFHSTDRILLALSGGVDSMVMADLCLRSGFTIGVAHCNFQLRGKEADLDETLVENFAKKHTLFHTSWRFDTEQYAIENGISIQMAARTLRYEWLEKERKQHGYDWIATAHHLDDILETFFINLARGTGIKGLTGIPDVRDRIVRPMLFATRESIEAYAEKNKIGFREDESNASIKYTRNLIRHTILPRLEAINPSFRRNFQETLEKMTGASRLYDEAVGNYHKELVSEIPGCTKIRLDALRSHPAGPVLLYEFLTPFNVPSRMIGQIIEGSRRAAGRQFYTATHRLVVDRGILIIQAYRQEEKIEFRLKEEKGMLEVPMLLDWGIEDAHGQELPPRDPWTATMDADLVDFPLTLRRWEQGDRFQPYGMKGQKRLSDFFSDLKLSLPEKESVWILTSAGGQIIWIIGYRIDHRFRITTNTKRILKITCKELRN